MSEVPPRSVDVRASVPGGVLDANIEIISKSSHEPKSTVEAKMKYDFWRSIIQTVLLTLSCAAAVGILTYIYFLPTTSPEDKAKIAGALIAGTAAAVSANFGRLIGKPPAE